MLPDRSRSTPGEPEALYAEVKERFPGLHFKKADGKLFLVGEFPIVHEGKVIDRYWIEITLPPNGTKKVIPQVCEIGGRIHRDSDHHINSKDGACCLFIPDEFWYQHSEGMNLVDFLNGPVRSFFIYQALLERGEKWRWGERSHGEKGIQEFYGSLIGTDDLARIISYLKAIDGKKLRRHATCPCGSGKRLDKCHIDVLKNLRDRIPLKVIRDSLRKLTKK